MNNHKGFAVPAALIVVFGILLIGGIGYAAMNPDLFTAPERPSVSGENDVQTAPGDHPEEDQVTVTPSDITWRFTSAGEVQGIPYTKVTVSINGVDYEAGAFTGSCSEIGANAGIDGKGLLIGEIAAAQCWFAGSGDEVGVFGHEDGGFEIMVGELSEGEQGMGLFRGNFKIIHTIRT